MVKGRLDEGDHDIVMTEVRLLDDGGDGITLQEHNGSIYPAFNTNALRNMSKIKIRSNDILISAYPKSGTHWIWEVVRLLVAGQIDNDSIRKKVYMLEDSPEVVYEDFPSPRILNTHCLYSELPEEAKTKKIKIVYITRNLKDVTVSYYNFRRKIPTYKYDGKWEHYIQPAVRGKFDYGSWFDHIKDWERVKQTVDADIFTLNYEDAKEETFQEIKKLSNFLELERSDEFLRRVCERTDFETMKTVKSTSSRDEGAAYRKGQVGDWRNWFTVAQNEWFDSYYEEHMKDCPLKFRFTLS